MVVVHAMTFGRAGAPISCISKVVARLNSKCLARTHAARRSRDVEYRPVMEGAARRVGVIHDQREALCALRGVSPAERRRLVRPVAGMVRGDRLSVLKCV